MSRPCLTHVGVWGAVWASAPGTTLLSLLTTNKLKYRNILVRILLLTKLLLLSDFSLMQVSGIMGSLFLIVISNREGAKNSGGKRQA